MRPCRFFPRAFCSCTVWVPSLFSSGRILRPGLLGRAFLRPCLAACSVRLGVRLGLGPGPWLRLLGSLLVPCLRLCLGSLLCASLPWLLFFAALLVFCLCLSCFCGCSCFPFVGFCVWLVVLVRCLLCVCVGLFLLASLLLLCPCLVLVLLGSLFSFSLLGFFFGSFFASVLLASLGF